MVENIKYQLEDLDSQRDDHTMSPKLIGALAATGAGTWAAFIVWLLFRVIP